MGPKVLLVEDDELASEVIFDYLSENGFEVVTVFTATDSISHFSHSSYDVVILDINLPDYDGFEVLKSLGGNTRLPVIVTSAYGDTPSKLTAFRYGACDYMVKPIDLEELEARIWAHLKRNSRIGEPEEKVTFRRERGDVFFRGSALGLTTVEYEILSLLVDRRNEVVRREELHNILSTKSSERALDNHIKKLRKKIVEAGGEPSIIRTVYGVGYSLKM